MAADLTRQKVGPLQLRHQTGKRLAPEEFAGRIVNMERTEEDTLRSMVGPVEYHPAAWQWAPLDPAPPLPTTYGGGIPVPHGIFHCKLKGGHRDVLLAHFGGGIRLHSGWGPVWEVLIAEAGAQYPLRLLEDDTRSGFLTQFVATPTGVVIIPQGARALFFDGDDIAPLGFSETPGAPTPFSPQSDQVDHVVPGAADGFNFGLAPNIRGYSHRGRNQHPQIGANRLGTVDNTAVASEVGGAAEANPNGGVVKDGEWRAAVQFLDQWGNLSPVSGLSAPAHIAREDNLTGTRAADDLEGVSALRVQIAWSDIDIGPDHCVGRLLYRTKDTKNTLTPGVFWVPPNATDSILTTSTLPDNVTSFYPDNTPDEWLLRQPDDVVPVPVFRLACMAFGRLWIGNTQENPGLIRASQPGFWGTFPANMAMSPDPSGATVTGMHAVPEGMLVFTETSTFLVVQYGDASGAISFQAKTINNSVGCVSPDSVKTLPNGMTVWLGRDAFFAWKDGEIGRVSGDIDHSVLRRIHKHARRSACAAIGTTAGIYRCWVPVDGSNVNNLGLEFDGVGWSEIDFIDAHCVCTTRDDREYMIAIGEVACTVNEVKKTSVWLLDHENQSLSSWDPSPRQSIIETTWLRNPRSARRGSARRISLWLQETGGTLESVEVMRDWRMHPTLNTGAGNEPELYLSEDPPLVWGTAVYDADYVSSYGKDTITQHFTSRRPFWTRIDVHVPSCEVFKIRLSHTGDFEFIGITYEDRDLDAGGAKRGGGAR